MRPITGVPYRRASADRVVCDPWQIVDEGTAHVLPTLLPHWDYNFDLALDRTVLIETAGVREDCSLELGEVLRFAAVWKSSGTAVRGQLARVELRLNDEIETVRLQGVIPASDLAASVDIETQLVVGRIRNGGELLPSIPGSILWQDTTTVLLEGKASRFPIEIVDFHRAMPAPDGAGWYLSWNRYDLKQPVLGGMQLLVNSRHSKVVDAISARNPDASAQAIRSLIHWDVARTLIRGALHNEEFVDNPSGYGSGSVGGAVARLIGLLFPGETAPSLRSALDERPEYFDSLLQAKTRLLWIGGN